jgi:hypothetical protein
MCAARVPLRSNCSMPQPPSCRPPHLEAPDDPIQWLATPVSLRAFLRADLDKWAPVIRRAGVYAG